MISYMPSVNSIYRGDTKTKENRNSILYEYTTDIEISEGYRLSNFKQILENFSDENFKTENIQEISEFLTQLNGNLPEDFIKFLQILKNNVRNKVEIFFIDEETSKGIYINIIFDKNTDFETVDKEINKIYDILEDINNNLWFVNIGERFNES